MPTTNASLDQLLEVLGEPETRGLVELYLTHTAAEIARLSTMPIDRQIMVVHALKGSSAQVGAKVFVAQCRAVEMGLRESQKVLTESQIENLKSEFDIAASPFRAWLATQPAS